MRTLWVAGGAEATLCIWVHWETMSRSGGFSVGAREKKYVRRQEDVLVKKRSNLRKFTIE